MRTGRRTAAAAALLVTLTLAGCVHSPEGDPTAYRAEAAATLDAATSPLGTTQLTLQAVLADRIFGTSADDTVTTAETALDSLASSFGALQPPRGADSVRDQAQQALSTALDAVSAARIAIRRGDRAGARSALGDVRAASAQVERLQQRWSS